MQAQFIHESEFRLERDFGTKVSATFEFLRAQFRPLLKCLAYFVLPGTMLFGIGMGLFFNNFMNLAPTDGAPGAQAAADFRSLTSSSFLGIGLAGLGALVAFLLLSSTVYGFVRVRMDTPAGQEVQPAQVWAYMRPRLGRVLLAWLLLMGLAGGLMVVVMVGAFTLMVPAIKGGGAGAILGGIGFFLLLCGAVLWFSVCLSLYFPALWMEDTDVWTALRRCFYLVAGKWWSSAGLYMVIAIIQSFLTYLFAIPMYGLLVLKMLKLPGLDSGVLGVVAMSIYALGVVITGILPLIAMLFQYFNLVERKEGVGLRMLVDSLGQTPAPEVSNAGFRPEEAGEY